MITTRTFVGMPPFPVGAKKALADSQLRSNIRNATHTIRTKRARVVAELDDFEQLREAAADIKDEVLVAGDNSCLMHIEGLLTRQRAGIRVMHLAEILAAQEVAA